MIGEASELCPVSRLFAGAKITVLRAAIAALSLALLALGTVIAT